MSHFTVLVIGVDPEAALQPFHEFECTGINDQYVQDVDETEDVRGLMTRDDKPLSLADALEYHGLHTATVADEQEVDRDGVHKYGFAVVKNGALVKAINRTNPNKKWDWWTVGGRWPNKLLFKDGTKGNRGKAGDLDLDGMLADQAAKAAELFDTVMSVISGRAVESWASVLKRRDAGEIDIEQARTFYNDQLVVKDLIEKDAIDRWDGAEQLSAILAAKDRASYMEREAQVNSSTWALLHDGHWHERGSMGWFGMSDATDGSTLDYAANFWLTLRALPPDTVVTVVDCHI